MVVVVAVVVKEEEGTEWRGKKLRRKWEESWKLLMAGFKFEVGQFSEGFGFGSKGVVVVVVAVVVVVVQVWKGRHGDAAFAMPTAADRSCGGSRSLGTAMGRNMMALVCRRTRRYRQKGAVGAHTDTTESFLYPRFQDTYE